MEKKYPIKTPELIEAKKEILKFLKKYSLDPRKDYSNHTKFGKEFRKLLFKLNKERDKIAIKYPLTDIKNLKKYIKMKKDKKAKKAAEKAAVEAPVKEAKKSKKVAKETQSETAKEEKNKKAPRTTGKYNYPLIDGREMTSAEKKKYRAEQRKANSDGAEKKEKKEKAPKTADNKEKSSKKDKKVAKEEKAEKKALKTKGNKDGKKKKVAKDED